MNAQSFHTILDLAAQAAGRDPAELAPDDGAYLAALLKTWLVRYWTYAPWPELMVYAERTATLGVVDLTGLGPVHQVTDVDYREYPGATRLPYALGSSSLTLLPPWRSQTSVWVETWTPEPDLMTLAESDLLVYEVPGRFVIPLMNYGAGRLLGLDGNRKTAGDVLVGVAEAAMQEDAVIVHRQRDANSGVSILI